LPNLGILPVFLRFGASNLTKNLSASLAEHFHHGLLAASPHHSSEESRSPVRGFATG